MPPSTSVTPGNLRRELIRKSLAAGYHLDLDALGLDGVLDGQTHADVPRAGLRVLLDGRRAFHVLVAHHAHEADVRQVVRQLGDVDTLLRIAHAGATHRRVHLDEDADVGVGGLRHAGDRADVVGIVDADLDIAAARESAEPNELVVGDDLVRYEYVGDAVLDHHLRFGDLRTAYASDRAAYVDLHLREERTLEVLGVGAHLGGGVAVGVGGDLQVALVGVHVHDQARRVEMLDGSPGGGCVTVHSISSKTVECAIVYNADAG